MEQNFNDVIKYGHFLVKFITSTINDEFTSDISQNIDFKRLYLLARFHSVDSLFTYGVEKLDNFDNQEILAQWKQARDLDMMITLQQQVELEHLKDMFQKSGISMLPLKGCIMKSMYHQSDYRKMGDLDILFQGEPETVRQLMESMEYEVDEFGISNHDVYIKRPYLNVELHRQLFQPSSPYSKYYEHIWDKAINDEGQSHLFHLGWDDFYIFLLVHFAKHYFGGGSGIRSIMDVYIFLQKHKQDLNEEYLKAELTKLDLLSFKEDVENLANIWFGTQEYDARYSEMEYYIFTSGVYGSKEHQVTNGLNTMSRNKYFWSRVFLHREGMLHHYPFLKKCMVLLPFCWIHRLVVSIFKKRDIVSSEIKMMTKSKKK